ncbi:MAG TPA: serine/threonine-protein kinase, partial [Nannocystaceae bacterium]|nr:serine/threonine-protein kinase [Nannocystaceae bacterium]
MSDLELDETVDDASPAPARGGNARTAGARYELREELARGGTGKVSRAHDRQLEREVAIKSLLDPSAHHGLRFAREARVTARLQHPSIVPIYDIGRFGDGQPYYAMKLVSGRTLDEAIKDTSTLAQRLALVPALIGVADAIAYAHAQRVIHRDLKPHNVVLGPFGESMVIDWGLAKQLDAPGITEPGESREDPDDPALTLEGAVLGTPAYMPPEQAAGKAVDERADVYALGAMLYHVLAGRPPYRGPNARAVLVEVLEGPPQPLASAVAGMPADLVAIVDKAMAREPAQRYADAQQLVADLRRFQTGQLVGAHHYTAWSHLLRFLRRHVAAVMVALVLGTVLLIGSVVAALQILAKSEIAEQQRKAAEAASALAGTQRDAAEALSVFMLDDLRARLEPIGRLDLLRGVGDRVQHYYATLAAAGVEEDELGARRRTQALALVGEAELHAGDLASAMTTLSEVHRLATLLGDRALAARAGER